MTFSWGITDGSAGMIAQVQSLAIAMNLSPNMKEISLKKPWSILPNICYDNGLKFCILSYALRNNKNIAEPYPDIIISCGRKAALVSAAIKNIQPQIHNIHIQDPQMSAKNFNVVVAMEHDKIQAKNVIKTRFALHSITKSKLESAKKKFTPYFANYPKPYISVLLGGSTNKYILTKDRMEKLIADLQESLASTKGSLLITPSRRTGEDNIANLKEVFSKNSNVYIYDAKSKNENNITENPYMGMLACADKILVTNDSVNMMSEAFATGKPVEILNLEDHKNTKPSRFAEMIKFQPRMTGDEMRKLAQEVNILLESNS